MKNDSICFNNASSYRRKHKEKMYIDTFRIQAVSLDEYLYIELGEMTLFSSSFTCFGTKYKILDIE